MNFTELLKKKNIPFWLCIAGDILALAALCVYFNYVKAGGTNLVSLYLAALAAIVIHIVLFFYNGIGNEILGILPPILFTIAGMAQLKSDYGNLVDKFNNIRMYGNRDLADMNIWIAVLLVAAAVLSTISCFTGREKKA